MHAHAHTRTHTYAHILSRIHTPTHKNKTKTHSTTQSVHTPHTLKHTRTVSLTESLIRTATHVTRKLGAGSIWRRVMNHLRANTSGTQSEYFQVFNHSIMIIILIMILAAHNLNTFRFCENDENKNNTNFSKNNTVSVSC